MTEHEIYQSVMQPGGGINRPAIHIDSRKPPRIIWTPQPRQAAFLRRPEYEVLYGGAAGGGKTDTALIWSLQPYQIPHYNGAIIRKTYPELEQIITRSLDLYPKIVPGCKYNDNKHVWRFPSGARIYLGSMHRQQDMTKYQGRQFERISFDELTHFTFAEYSYMFSRNRPNGEGIAAQIRGYTNPGGIGHVWVKGRFIDGRVPEQSYVSIIEVNGVKYKRHRCFIPATVFDNPALLRNDPNYVASMAMLPEATRNALLGGSWDSFSGQAFVEWRDSKSGYKTRQWTHVIEPFKIPANWRLFRSFDFGYSRPFSVIWYAQDNDGRMYAIRELYGTSGVPNEGCKWHPAQIAQAIRKVETEEFKDRGFIRGIADPSIWDASRGESIATMMEREGVFWIPGDNKRIPGKQQIHWRLAFDDEGYPMLYVFSTCKHVIRTVPSLVYDPIDVEDIDTDGEDHCLTGDTLVHTTAGLLRMQELVGRDDIKLYGADGCPREYAGARLTQKGAKVLKIVFDNGVSVRCTPEHRFMMANGTWVRATDMIPGTGVKSVSVDMTHSDTGVMSCESQSSARQCKSTTGNGSTSVVTIFSTEGRGCTGLCGRHITARYRGATTSITRTMTRATTRSVILSSCQRRHTLSTTQADQSLLRRKGCTWKRLCDQRRLSGTRARPGENGIQKTANGHGLTVSQSPIGAHSVEKNSPQGIGTVRRQTASAIRTAKQHTAESDCVKVLSIRDAGTADVYNLHVPDGNAYLIEGGIVTHNCYDSLRYMMMDHPIPPRKHNQPPIVLDDPLNLHTPPVEPMFIHM